MYKNIRIQDILEYMSLLEKRSRQDGKRHRDRDWTRLRLDLAALAQDPGQMSDEAYILFQGATRK